MHKIYLGQMKNMVLIPKQIKVKAKFGTQDLIALAALIHNRLQHHYIKIYEIQI